jgi:hypothetical protein
MTISTRSAKVVAPISYEKDNGKMGLIPKGPCLIEKIDDDRIDVVWGAQGQSSTVLKTEDILSATTNGKLIFLD